MALPNLLCKKSLNVMLSRTFSQSQSKGVEIVKFITRVTALFSARQVRKSQINWVKL